MSEANHGHRYDYRAFEGLSTDTLRGVADPRLSSKEREAAARLGAFLLDERASTEAVAGDVLTAAQRALEVPAAVLTLMLALRDTHADHQRVAAGPIRFARRALGSRNREAFLVLVESLVGLGTWGRDLPASWRTAIVRSYRDRSLRSLISRTSEAYARRVGLSFFVRARLVRGEAHTGGAA